MRKFKNKRIFFFPLVILLLFLTVFIALKRQEVRQRASLGTTASLLISPDQFQTAPNSTFSAELSLNPNQNKITGIDIVVNFNKDVLELLSFNPEERPLNNILVNEIDNTQGSLHYSAVNTDDSSVSQRTIKLGTLSFKAKGEGTSSIDFADVKIIALNQADYLSNSGNTQASFKVIKEGPNADLDVAYIERTPRYYRYCANYPYGGKAPPVECPSTENQKRWPDAGENVTYTAHILNKGTDSSPSFSYKWYVDNVEVKSGTHQGLSPQNRKLLVNEEDISEKMVDVGDEKESLTIPWEDKDQKIKFIIDPSNSVTEITKTNNSLTIGSFDSTLSFWIETGYYDAFNRTLDKFTNSYSFEDWLQMNMAKFNQRLSDAKYPVSPDGVKEKLRIDKIVVANSLDYCSDKSLMRADMDTDYYKIDGRWVFVDTVCDNKFGRGLAGRSEDELKIIWQNWANIHLGIPVQGVKEVLADGINWNMIHEMGHQIGLIDLYRFNLGADSENNHEFYVTDLNNRLINTWRITADGGHILFSYPDRMGGGDTSPYRANSGTYFSSHIAGSLNSSYHKRRGFYGDYLYDTPDKTYLKIIDSSGKALAGARLSFYQKDLMESVYNMPDIVGTTDREGLILLPNRPAKHFNINTNYTYPTGHTIKDGPFGYIDHEGANGSMFVRITKDNQEDYKWLTVLDLNLAYWQGGENSSTIEMKTNFTVPSSSDNTVPGTVSDLSVIGSATTNIVLQWSGQKENGENLYYDIRYNTRTIDEGNWEDSIKVPVSVPLDSSGIQKIIVTDLKPQTLYYFGLKVLDKAGNISSISNIASGNTPAQNNTNGLKAEYYSGNNFNTYRTTRVDPEINFIWRDLMPLPGLTDHFSVRWTGQVEPQLDGTYTFEARGEDGMKLWVDNRLILDYWFNNPPGKPRHASVNLQGGKKYNIKMEYFEDSADAWAQLSWYAPFMAKTVIPQSQLFPEAPAITPTSTPTLTRTPTPPPPSASPASGPLPGDINGDGSLDMLDYNIWRDEFLKVVNTKTADLNRDGKVDLIDFTIWRNAVNSQN